MFGRLTQKGPSKKMSGWTNQWPNSDGFTRKGRKGPNFETALLHLLFPDDWIRKLEFSQIFWKKCFKGHFYKGAELYWQELATLIELFVLSGPEKVKLEEIVNVSLSANYEEGTLVAQATLSLAVRYAKKSLKKVKKLSKDNI